MESGPPSAEIDPRPLMFFQLGRQPFRRIWELQKRGQQMRLRGEIPDSVLIVEHEPVVTCGTSTGKDSLLASEAEFAEAGIEVVRIERGGDATYHGPGQLVVYPLINLSGFRRDVGWYMRSLEEVALQLLSEYSLTAQRIPGKTGVWISPQRKIASLGVRISRWCTMHGMALNITRESESGFKTMHPCGLVGISMTSIERELNSHVSLSLVQSRVPEIFQNVFGRSSSEVVTDLPSFS